MEPRGFVLNQQTWMVSATDSARTTATRDRAAETDVQVNKRYRGPAP